MQIEFTLNNVVTSFTADLPETIYLRHDWNRKNVLCAAAAADAYDNDPKNMYHYSELVCAEHPVVAFFWCKSQHILPQDVCAEQYQLLATHKFFEIILTDEGHQINEWEVAPPPELPEPNPDAIVP